MAIKIEAIKSPNFQRAEENVVLVDPNEKKKENGRWLLEREFEIYAWDSLLQQFQN